MSAQDSQPSFIENLKEQYEGLMASLEEKGVPSPRAILPVLLIALLLAGAYFSLPSVVKRTDSLTLLIKNSEGNPLPRMEVRLYDKDSPIGKTETDFDGKATFKEVPLDSDLKAKVTDPNGVYAEIEESISFSATEISLTQVQGGEAQITQFAVWVSDTANQYVREAEVRLILDDGSAETLTSDFSGVATFSFENVPEHATLRVIADDFEEYAKDIRARDIEAGSISVSLESDRTDDSSKEQVPEIGDISISLTSASDTQLSDILVSLKDASTFRLLKSARSDGDGAVLFEGVLIGRELVVEVSESAKYLGSSSNPFRLSSSGDVLELSVFLEEKLTGDYIDLLVTGDGAALGGAVINRFDLEGKHLGKVQTVGDGKATMLVSKDEEFYLTAYSQGFLPASFIAGASSSRRTLELTRETEENSFDLEITAIEEGDGAERAEISIFKEDGSFLGIPPKYTDHEGRAVFSLPSEISGAAYKFYAKAVKDASAGESAMITSGFDEAIEITLVGNPASIEISLTDALKKQQVPSGRIEALDEGGVMLASCELTAGKCVLEELPANSEITLRAQSPQYLVTTSAPLSLSPSEFRKVALQLISQADASSVTVAFVGLTNQRGEAITEAGNGETYDAKFLVGFPLSADVAGFHLHLTSPSGFVEIGEWDFAGQSVYTSSKYSKEGCYLDEDAKGKITSLDLIFPKGTTGAKQVVAKIRVDATAPADSSFALNFKSYAQKNGIIFTSPSEEQLEAEPLLTPFDLVKRACSFGNSVFEQRVTSSPLICAADSSFCRKFRLEDEILLGSDFNIQFEVLSTERISTIAVQSGNVKLLEATAGTDLADEPIAITSGKEQGIAVEIPVNLRTPGTLRMKAIRAGTTDLQLKFKSEARSFTFHQNVKISGQNLLKVAATPLKIIAGEQRKIRASVFDEQGVAVPDAIITLYDCERSPLGGDELLLSGNGDKGEGEGGIYSFDLSAISSGKIGIRVDHPEFKRYDGCIINVETPEDSLKTVPSSLTFKGDSSGLLEQSVEVASTLDDAKGTLLVISNCGSATSPVLYAFPNSVANFKDSIEVQVGVLPNITVASNCQLIFENALSQKESVRIAIPVRIDVTSPEVQAIGNPALPVMPSIVNLALDENGFADKFFSTSGIGEVAFCDIRGSDDFNVAAECNKDMVHISADYSSETIDRSFRQKGSVIVRTTGQLTRTFTVIVTAPDAPIIDASPTAGAIASAQPIYYRELPPLPDPIVFTLNPNTRRFDNYYSLGNLGGLVDGCEVQGIDYGITADICGPLEQRVHVLADFSGYDTYNKLLQRIYSSNPACYYYFENAGYGNSNLGTSGQYYDGGYSQVNINGNGYYPLPQYAQGYVDYSSYPQMGVSAFSYPQIAATQSNLGQGISVSQQYGTSTYDSRFNAAACNAGYVEGSLLVRFQSGGTRSVKIRIIAEGATVPRQSTATTFTMQNEVLPEAGAEVDPFTFKRFVHHEISFISQTQMPSAMNCKLGSDPAYFSQLQSMTNYRTGAPSAQNFGSSPSSKLQNAVNVKKCSQSQNGVILDYEVDLGKAAAPSGKKDGTLNKEGELYAILHYPSVGLTKLLPLALQLGSKKEYDLEPLSKNLQFVLTDGNGPAAAKFKQTDDVLTENCKLSSWGSADEAKVSELGGLGGVVGIPIEVENGKFKPDGNNPALLIPEDNKDSSSVEIPLPMGGKLSCDGILRTHSSTLHSASFRKNNEQEIPSEAGKRKLAYDVPYAGKIITPDDGKAYLCEIESSTFPQTKQTEFLKCVFNEKGLHIDADYEELLKERGTSEKESEPDEIIDLLTISLYSVPEEGEKAAFEKRKLAELELNVFTKGADRQLPDESRPTESGDEPAQSAAAKEAKKTACKTLLGGEDKTIIVEIAKSTDLKYDISNICISGEYPEGNEGRVEGQVSASPSEEFKLEVRLDGNADVTVKHKLGLKFTKVGVKANGREVAGSASENSLSVAPIEFFENQLPSDAKVKMPDGDGLFGLVVTDEVKQIGEQMKIEKKWRGILENDGFRGIVILALQSSQTTDSSEAWAVANCEVSPRSWLLGGGVKFRIWMSDPSKSDIKKIIGANGGTIYANLKHYGVATFCSENIKPKSELGIGENDIGGVFRSLPFENIEVAYWDNEDVDDCSNIYAQLYRDGKPLNGSPKVVCRIIRN